ncbi:MAG: Holliday junction branch migration protein RuvA [Candidatus Latescibacteria bacterium]|nr:Holliday junction branch migration protein RuvA [Candidatus Latescibacterota bacterium]
MISRVRGRVVSAHPRCIVEVGGVGFEVAIPEKDRESLAPTDAEIVFHTHLVVREDRLSLFGFLHRDDRELFLKLIEVSGVGPKLALAVLSLHPAARVVTAIKKGDAAFLSKIPGIGKKTAERLGIELGDKLDDLVSAEEPEAPMSGGVREEVLLALTSLGMTRSAAEAALDRMDWSPEAERSVEDVVRDALKYASRG